MVIKTNQLTFDTLLQLRSGDYFCYHDENKPERRRMPVTGHGSLLFPASERIAAYTTLQMLREGYAGRLHFTDLGVRGERFEVAKRWVETFFSSFIDTASFKGTFALHDGPIALPYPGDNGYQRHAVQSTSSNLVGHVRWVLPHFDALEIHPVFDGTDNFRERMYLRLAVDQAGFRINERRRRGRRRYPAVAFGDISFRSSEPAAATTLDEAIDAEFLQLTDLLLGATAQALRFLPSGGTLGRRRLAARVHDEIALRFGSPWYMFNRHLRHFSVSLYPDRLGRMYAANPLGAKDTVDTAAQPSLLRSTV